MKQFDLKREPMHEKKLYKKAGYLLDDIAILTGCPYLSELRYVSTYQRRIPLALKSINPQDYPLRDWADAAEYLIVAAPVFKTVFEAYDYLLQAFETCFGA